MHSALSFHIGAEAEAVAVAHFERQYARLLTELAQQRTDFWGSHQAVAAAQCTSPLAARVLSPARVSELLRTGLCVVDDALSEGEILAARKEVPAGLEPPTRCRCLLLLPTSYC